MSPLSDITYAGNSWLVKKHKDIEDKNEDRSETQNASEGPHFTKKETRAFVFYSLRMTIAIALVFIVAFAVFILFCIFVWFK